VAAAAVSAHRERPKTDVRPLNTQLTGLSGPSADFEAATTWAEFSAAGTCPFIKFGEPAERILYGHSTESLALLQIFLVEAVLHQHLVSEGLRMTAPAGGAVAHRLARIAITAISETISRS
jgi:hypothetical protein